MLKVMWHEVHVIDYWFLIKRLEKKEPPSSIKPPLLCMVCSDHLSYPFMDPSLWE